MWMGPWQNSKRSPNWPRTISTVNFGWVFSTGNAANTMVPFVRSVRYYDPILTICSLGSISH